MATLGFMAANLLVTVSIVAGVVATGYHLGLLESPPVTKRK